MIKVKRALISVSDKKKLKKILGILSLYKIELISSGGTFKEIKKLKFQCKEVSDYTNSPEILGGRVKTLHPKIYGGILSKRKNKSHKKDLLKNNFSEIDLVIVNFYPFEKVISSSKSHKKIIENIDIGGPTMVRAAAKNYNDVTVITNPNQYENLFQELKKNKGSTSLNFRKKMSQKAFNETAYYDSIISNYFNKFTKNRFPEKKTFTGNLIEKLRYGENPHQEGAIYSIEKNLEISQIHGKKLSYNNYNDIFSALLISKSLPKNTGTVIVKHTNPCGVSILKNPVNSYKSALACDPISAFGGVVSCNYKINKHLAKELSKKFLEVIIANGFNNEALQILKKKQNLRLIDAKDLNKKNLNNLIIKFGSILIQSSDEEQFIKKKFKIVSKMKPTTKQLNDLIFAFNICRYVKSNAIVIANNKSTVGIGSGQPSRLDSCKIAIEKLNKFQPNFFENSVAASDAFFPFIDGIETLIQSGVSAIIQPYGSIRDKEIIKFANKTNTVLIFSKTRHFRH
ncbi:bifunctional phosphoribosylaminoimidazolecarboxamide formyltransferase/IMP cyclohydrolase [Candidatus Pelagibacter sp.]|nr:bifunctional phosphoribosylaminoimidazolecarboxamide formyltransferase/IMP cyclohydrolase [Candidatus Pelagibacter sp.]